MKSETGRHDDRVSGKLPEWRASDGIFKEKWSRKKDQKGRGKKEKQADNDQDQMTGYKDSSEEKEKKKTPKKLMDIGNSYGNLSIGVSEDKRLVTLTTKQRVRETKTVRSESKELRGDSAINLQKVPGTARTNNGRKEESAVEYKNDANRQMPFLMDRMTNFSERYDFDVQEDTTPFLSIKEEWLELKSLRAQRNNLSKMEAGVKEKDDVENQIEYLEAVIRDKNQERRRMQKRLLEVRKEALEQKEEKYASRLLHLWKKLDEGQEDGSESEAEAEDEEDNEQEDNEEE